MRKILEDVAGDIVAALHRSNATPSQKRERVTDILKEHGIGTDVDTETTDAVSGHFGLSYASWLTLPRVVLQAMPNSWQNQLVALLDQIDERFDWMPEGVTLSVTARDDKRGHFKKLPDDFNYRYPDKKWLRSIRRKAGAVNRSDVSTELDTPDSENVHIHAARLELSGPISALSSISDSDWVGPIPLTVMIGPRAVTTEVIVHSAAYVSSSSSAFREHSILTLDVTGIRRVR